MSCHYYQSDSYYYIPSETSVIDYVNEYFEIFQNNVQNNTMDAMNLKLTLLIVEKFKKIFQLWDENRILERCIDKEIFEDIYILMSSTFDDGSDDTRDICSTNDFFLECKHCGEEIQLRNNDCRYSYEFHKISPEHVEFLQNLGIEDDSDSEEPPEPEISLQNCEENSTVSTDSTPEVLFIHKFDKECIVFEKGAIRCSLCFSKLSSTQGLLKHMNSLRHASAFIRYKSNVEFIARNKDDTLRCALCNITTSRLSSFLEHCLTYDHRLKLFQLSQSQSDCSFIDINLLQFPSDDSLVDITNRKFKCPICMTFVYGIDELFEHFNAIDHKNKDFL